jgi:hypothetical protein
LFKILTLILIPKLNNMYLHFRPKLVKICLGITLLFFLSDCKKEDSEIVPYVQVHYELTLTSELADLGVGMLVTITPYKSNSDYSTISYHNAKYRDFISTWKTYGNGIILYRKDYDEYQAFDLTCTYRAFEDHCALVVEGKGILPECPCCHSKFIIISDGIPANGDSADTPLKQYNTYVDGLKLIVAN